jgi:SAM-dependent methyltransferase
MPMTQEDIRAHYEKQWHAQGAQAGSAGDLAYSSPVEDAVLYPAYEGLLKDLRREPNGARLLDVGAGSGRWLRFFLSRYTPAAFVGIDFALASVELLKRWGTTIDFRHANIADPQLDLGERFDLINIANVLFHIPEPDLFEQAMKNLRKHLAPGGAIVTTEYMPRDNYRTEWMSVRSRYVFEDAARRVGLKISTVRAFSFFSNDPMGLDGPDSAGRVHFNNVRACMQQVMTMSASPEARAFFVQFFSEIERATLAFARERVAEVDLPSQKLVVLTEA